MAEGYTLGVGFYPVDPKTGAPHSGPHYTRQQALEACRHTPCIILEVVGDWQHWLDTPGTLVPFDNVAQVQLADGRTLEHIRLAPDVHLDDLPKDGNGLPIIQSHHVVPFNDVSTGEEGFVDKADLARWAGEGGNVAADAAESAD